MPLKCSVLAMPDESRLSCRISGVHLQELWPQQEPRRRDGAEQCFLSGGGWSHLHFLWPACWDGLGTSHCSPHLAPEPTPTQPGRQGGMEAGAEPLKGQQQSTPEVGEAPRGAAESPAALRTLNGQPLIKCFSYHLACTHPQTIHAE